GLLDDRRASLTVLARDTISAGDYVVVTDKGATPLKQTKSPGSGAVLGRALERIRAGHRGQVREVSPKASPHRAANDSSETGRWAWTALQRYTGWLGHDKSSNNMRAVITALGVVLDEQSGPDIRAAAIAKVQFGGRTTSRGRFEAVISQCLARTLRRGRFTRGQTVAEPVD